MVCPEANQQDESEELNIHPGVAPMGLRGIVRNILAYVFGMYSLLAVVFAFVTSFVMPIRVRARYLHWWTNLWIEVQLGLFGVRVHVDGLDRFDDSKTFILVANHRSWMDSMAIILALKSVMNLVFLIKRSLLYVPLIGWYLKWAGFIGVGRSAGRGTNQESLNLATERIRKNWSVLIFPEGTRSRTHAFQRFRRGAVDLAIAAQVPILPVVISGTARIFPPGSPFIRPGPVRVEFLTPIFPDREKSHEGLMQEVRIAIANRYRLTADGIPLEDRPDWRDRLMASTTDSRSNQGLRIHGEDVG